MSPTDSGLRELVAAHHWEETAVGPMAGWPKALHVAVDAVLGSRFSMWMAWGPELTVFYNDAYRRDTLGVKHPWALGRPAREVWSEVWEEAGPRIEHVLQTGEATWDEALMLFLERSGYTEETYHTFSYSPLPDDNGRIAGMLCVVAEETDRVITERRMTTLRDLGVDLARCDTEEQLLAAACACLGANGQDVPFAAIYLRDETGLEAGCTVGLPDDHPLTERNGSGLNARLPLSGGSTLVDLSGWPEVPAGVWPQPAREAYVAPVPGPAETRPAGYLLVGANPMRPLDDEYRGFVDLLAGQISASLATVRARDEERRRAQALAELDQAKTEFFSNVSHEFRTPLTLIAGPADDALSDPAHPLPDMQRERIEIVRRNARRLRRLVDTMLDFSRIEAGRLQPELVAVDLGELTRAAVHSFAPAVERAGLELRIESPDVGEASAVDVDMWEKIVFNLLSNALKFTLNGSITVRLHAGDDTVELEVSDTGVGIAEEELPRLFDRFHRARPSEARSHEGTGIGLALVHELVALHDGTIEADSMENVGTRFTVRLPRRLAPTSTVSRPVASSSELYVDEALQWMAEEQEPAAVAPDVAVGDTAGSTVLVVEDNADLRRFITRLLEPHWNVVAASDGAEALRLARADPPDLVLSDVMMPGLDGFGLLAALRADPATRLVAVVLLSARAGQDAAIEGLQAGADDYLVKPFSSHELVARVRSNLELARLRNQEAAWRTTLVGALQDGFFVADLDGTVTEINDAFAEITGYDRAGLPYQVPLPWWPDEETDTPDLMHHLASRKKAMSETGHARWTVGFRHRDGHRIWVSVSAATTYSVDGSRDTLVGTVRDITREHRRSLQDQVINTLTSRLASASDTAEVWSAALQTLRETWPVQTALITQRDRDGGLETNDPQRPWEDLDESVRTIVHATHDDGLSRRDLPWVTTRISRTEACVAIVRLQPGADFDDFDQALIEELCRRVEEALVRARLYEQQRAASVTLQRAILGPSRLPDGFSARYEPAGGQYEVGGDWFDVVSLGHDRFGLIVGDCVGRGMTAAAVMGQLRSATRTLLLQAHTPSAVLMTLDEVAAMTSGADCTTVFCAIVDREGGTLTYSIAGHLPGILVHADGSHSLLDGGLKAPLATGAGVRHDATAHLHPGSTVVIYTDGLVERRDREIDEGMDALRETLVAARDRSPETLAAQIASEHAPGGHDDDVAYLIYRHPHGDDVRRHELVLPAEAGQVARLRRELVEWLAPTPFDRVAVEDLLLACSEAAANAIEHGCSFDNRHQVRVSAEVTDDYAEIVIHDDGAWKEADAESASLRGHGLPIIRKLTDEVEVEAGPDGTRVRMRRYV